MRTVYLQKFISQRKVSLAAAAAMIVSGDGLSEADSVHAEQYAKHAQTYQGKVRELQQEAAELS